MSIWSQQLKYSGLVVVVVAAQLALSAGTAGAAPVPREATSVATNDDHDGGRSAGSYTNPLSLQLPGGQQAASCADPFVLRGAAKGDEHWYLYCTSDALTATELGADGRPLIHTLPTFSSTDLVTWTYVGDALPDRPSWVSADAGIWAPDVIYRNGTYLLYYAASNTTLPGGGSAVGVATSPNPTGPWTDSGRPVVEPQAPPGGNPTDRRWEFDPEVITAGGKSYIYFGSYFGGIAARELSPDGLSSDPAGQVQIATDNRYEGTFIVKHDGWYYFMGSAANCCAGPLTGYSVFSARSRNPLGPFADRDGVAILASRVGGTPALTQNGNTWVGAGHNAVITDFTGKDWIVYHAVNRNDPYYAGDVGYTKRPVLMDPLDWINGWPTTRGGRGPSDTRQPAPAAQPGQRTAYHPSVLRDPQPGRLIRSLSDDFAGSTLAPRWTWVRPPAAGSATVANGQFRFDTQDADLHPPAANLASVLTEAAPQGDYVVETRVAVNVEADGCCHNYVQGGLLIYNDDGQYIKLSSVSIWNTRQTEIGKEEANRPAGVPDYGNGVVGPVGDSTYLRIVARRGSTESQFTGYTSVDGRHWDRGDTWTQPNSTTSKIGLISMGGLGYTSTFDYVRVSTIAGQ